MPSGVVARPLDSGPDGTRRGSSRTPQKLVTGAQGSLYRHNTRGRWLRGRSGQVVPPPPPAQRGPPNLSRDHPGEGIASRLPFGKLDSDRSPAVYYLKCEGTSVSSVWAHSTLSAHDLDQVVLLSFLVIKYRETQDYYHATIMEKSLSQFLCHLLDNFLLSVSRRGFTV